MSKTDSFDRQAVIFQVMAMTKGAFEEDLHSLGTETFLNGNSVKAKAGIECKIYGVGI
jgi:hypothetical protein